MSQSNALVGIVANPVSARDIRRVIANATSLQVSDRANIVLRVLAALGACGVGDVVMMPENGGIRGLLMRGLERERNRDQRPFPCLHHTATPVRGTVEDTLSAVDAMLESGVKAIVVLGGDGTHRAVVSRCGAIPVAGISTGTNNVFPEYRESTIVGLAVGLVVTGRVPHETALAPNKLLRVRVNDGERVDLALVDVAVSAERYIGARALWRTENFRELFVTFADPAAIGMSAIAGLVCPLGRREPGGLHLHLEPEAGARSRLHATIAPGLVRPIGIGAWRRIDAGQAVAVNHAAGTIALDGEREFEFGKQDLVTVTLEESAFRTVDVSACMHYAAVQGLFVEGAPNPLR